MINKFITVFILLISVFLLSCQVEDLRPNVILIMADDLGYGDLSSYGSQSIHTPHIDKIGEEGVRFTDFYSNGPVCSPTRAALLSGKYQQKVGIDEVVFTWVRDSVGLSTDVVTIAEVFKDNGYTTGIIGKWHLGYKKEFNPLNQGFDHFEGYVSGNVDYHSHLDNMNLYDW